MTAPLIDLDGAQPVVTVALVAVPVQSQQPPPGRGEEFGKASPIGLVVVILLGLATVLLIRNMTKRIKRLPQSFDEPADERADEAPDRRP
ncbi:hypothetical protein [Pseudonocardia sp.]|uniref:hypothetical protein n=1 Tax=Pseudonocardia sp. TaxID=60912 RepID=UPI003D1302C9